ncbi:MAG: PAS domain S-box protein [Actinomycetota bacterium]
MQIPLNSGSLNQNDPEGEYSVNLKQSEERYRTLVANIPGAVYRCTYNLNDPLTPPGRTMVFLSDTIQEIVGYSPSDLVHNRVQLFANLIHPQDRIRVETAIAKSVEIRQPYILEYRLIHSDRGIRWVYEKGQVIEEEVAREYREETSSVKHRASDPMLYLDGVILDITERKQTEAELSRLALVPQHTQNSVIITDADGGIEWVNQSFTRMSGYVLAEVRGKNLAEVLLGTKTDPETRAQLQAAIATRELFEGEIYHDAKDGQGYWLSVAMTPIYQEPGEFQGLIAVANDITAVYNKLHLREQTEEALRQSESYYRCIVETASEGVWIFDTESKTTFANSRMAEMLGYSVEELLGRSLFEFIDCESQAIAQTYVERRRQGIRERHDFKFIRSDGSHLWAIVSATPLFNSRGEFAGVLRMITDISDVYDELRLRKQAEAELRATLQELEFEKFALDQSAIVAITNDQGVITYANDQFCDISQYSRQELIGKTHRIVNSGYHPSVFFENLWSTITQGEVWHGEIKNKAKDGTFYWVDTTIVPFVDDNGKPYQYVAIRKNITDRKQVEEALRQSEQQLRAKNQELAHALYELQQTQTMMVQNEKMVSLGQLVAGVAHEINNPVSFIYGNIMHADEYFQDLLRLVQIYQQEYPQPTPNIEQELETIDFDFLFKDLPKLLNSMKIGAERIRQIVQSLRNFSRLDQAEQKQVDIHEGIESTLLILQHRFKETAGHPKIVLIKEYGNLPLVSCYAGQLNQVFMNIISNAIDALEEAMERGEWVSEDLSSADYCPSPTIWIRTEIKHEKKERLSSTAENLEQPICGNCALQASSSLVQSQTHPSYIVIRISDNGPGIPVEVQKKLFDPFFTLKKPGKGTGLGLSISYQIVVEKHGGQLQCHSEPGQGAEFIIEIPIDREASKG